MGRSSGGGGRSSGGGSGSGGGVSDPEIEAAKEGYKDESSGSNSSDVGNLVSYIDNGETDTGNAKADAAMVAAFRRGEVNNNPALVIETGIDQYKAIDARSATIIKSADAAGVKFNSIIVKNDPKHISAARETNRIQSKDVSFRKRQPRTAQNNIGNLSSFSGSTFNGGSTKGYSGKDVNRAAKSVLKNNSRVWAPVHVKATGADSYKVIGSRFGLDVAAKAGVKPWFIEVE